MLQKFRPKLIPTLATIVGLIILISLGTWQLQRYYEKLEIEDQLAKKADLPPLAIDALPEEPKDLRDLSYRVISISGKLDMDYAVLFKHRQYEHHPGFWLAAPLVTSDNRAIWANLGWVPFDNGPEVAQEIKPNYAQPQTYTGLLYILPQNIADTRNRLAIKNKELSIKDSLSQWYTYDIQELLTQTPYAMGYTPAVLVLNESHSGKPFPLASNTSITKPYMTAERHQGYYLFWYSTAGALLLLYLGASFGVIGSFAQRKPKTIHS